MSKKQDKGRPIFGLEKLPAEVLLKASREEVGMLDKEITRLKVQLDAACAENARLAKRCIELEKSRRYNDKKQEDKR